MLICDTHADTLWRMAEPEETAGRPFDITREYLTVPGHVYVQALALYVSTGGMLKRPTVVEQELAAFEQLKALGWRQIRNVDEALPGCANVMLTIEGCEAFGGDPANAERFAELGVRIAALTWNNENGLCYPAASGSRQGLTALGRETVKRMRAHHMAVDVSHLNERGFFDLMDGSVPPMASHSCAKKLCGHLRNLSDDQLKALFEAKGFVGVNFYPAFLSDDHRADVDRVIDHMAYMCDKGGEDCVGLGSDFDGIEEWPDGLRSAADVPKLLERMMKRGFGQKLTEKIAGLNFKNYMERI